MKYKNSELNFSFELNDKFKEIEEKDYEKFGIVGDVRKQVLNIFMNTENKDQVISMTRDAQYTNEDKAIHEGVDLNLSNLERCGAKILKQQYAITDGNRKIVKCLYELSEMPMVAYFTAVNNVLICINFAQFSSDNFLQNEVINLINSIK